MAAKKCQSLLEYVFIVTIVVAASVLMSLYVRRAIQANLKIFEEETDVDALPPTTPYTYP